MTARIAKVHDKIRGKIMGILIENRVAKLVETIVLYLPIVATGIQIAIKGELRGHHVISLMWKGLSSGTGGVIENFGRAILRSVSRLFNDQFAVHHHPVPRKAA